MNLRTLQDTPPWDWPDDAAETFQEVLADRRADPSERLIAAKLAGDLVAIDDETAALLIRIVGSADEPEDLRAAAAISLGPVLELSDTDGFEDPDDVPISEETFRNIQGSLHSVYSDEGVPKLVRRRILEASVRSQEEWHREAILNAWSGGDREWMLTAAFAMKHVRGFDDQIMEALKNPDEEIHYQAVEAAGNWGVAGAWSHIAALAADPSTEKYLRIAAIGAIGTIRPAEALDILAEIDDSDDEDLEEAVMEARTMAEGASDWEDDDFEEDEDDEDEWIN